MGRWGAQLRSKIYNISKLVQENMQNYRPVCFSALVPKMESDFKTETPQDVMFINTNPSYRMLCL